MDACELSRCWWMGSSGHVSLEMPFRLKSKQVAGTVSQELQRELHAGELE